MHGDAPMGPEERARRRNFFRATGISGRPDNTQLKAHLAKLTKHISVAEISRRSGVPEATIWYQLNEEPSSCYIPTLQALAKVRLRPDDLGKMTQEERLWGAYRIVQGLAALGWTGDAIGEATGLTGHMVRAMGRTPHPRHLNQTGEGTYQALLLGAQKLECQHPVRDGGVSETVYKSTKARARTRGSAPLGVWDLDTVHDPAAVPEWTGACGSLDGRRIHRREGIPLCDRCREATGATGTAAPGAFSPRKFRQARLDAGFSQRKFELAAGFAEGTIHHWETGRSVPRRKSLEKAISVLPVTFEDVFESEE